MNNNRYCVVCERKREFQYNRTIGHSECVECGSRFARKYSPLNDEVVQKTIQQYEQRIRSIKDENKIKLNNIQENYTNQIKKLKKIIYDLKNIKKEFIKQ